jgi:hypothetical protein
LDKKKNKFLRKIRRAVNYKNREKDEILKDSKIKRKEKRY